MFAYCLNNPIRYSDPSGRMADHWETFKKALEEILKESSGVFVAGAGMTQLDTPAPGAMDIVGLAVIAGAFIVCAGQAVASTITLAQKQQEKQKTEKSYQFWEAQRIGNSVVTGRGLSVFEASVRVECGLDIMCANQAAANWILKINGYRNAVGPEIHGDDGYYWHYHPNRNSHTHIWYY